MSPQVVISRSTLPGGGLARLENLSRVICFTGSDRPTAAEFAELVAGADGIVCLGNDRIDAALLDAAGPQLQVVALCSMGFDAVDRESAAARGVVVTHTPGVLAETTADLTFALIMMARRRLVSATDSLRSGGWDGFRMDGYLGQDVHGATLGLIGYGQIGKAMARRAAGFGMRVRHLKRASAPSDELSQAVEMSTLLGESDIISISVPLTPDTQQLIGAAELAQMKPTATLVNTGRGGVVDEKALLYALKNDRLHSAGLDVYRSEPITDDLAALSSEPRLVVLPHIGSATEATRARMVDVAVDNVLEVLAGRPARTPLPGSAGRPSAVRPGAVAHQ